MSLNFYNSRIQPRTISTNKLVNFDEYNQTKDFANLPTSLGEKVSTLTNSKSDTPFVISSSSNAPRLLNLGLYFDDVSYLTMNTSGFSNITQFSIWFDLSEAVQSGVYEELFAFGSSKVYVNPTSNSAKFEPDEGTSTPMTITGDLNGQGLNNLVLVVDKDMDRGYFFLNGTFMSDTSLGLAMPMATGIVLLLNSDMITSIYRFCVEDTTVSNLENRLIQQYNDDLPYFTSFAGETWDR
ncbi:MAG: hypothetical protein OMM_00960 [Candidatus Magnetoglobus multicellularis str. Araruama]|uniref:Uncharacterized protein n=1 Tax=Candidatus Magnetoglobus multicellularis str. Araruama TaxID=890399 RepID=A0A1V1PEX4_9BACT|nr:MAG: hypothetical protein OMM_00960 [Candidatus Magnetoglobus multicellularis str. Araruama]